jgi:MFS family permease
MTNTAHRAQQAFKLSSLTLSVYLPTLFFSIGEGVVLPIIPLFARERGASVAVAALVVAMRSLGTMLFDLPSGVVVSRFGDRGAMVAGSALVAVVAVGASLSRSAAVLGVLILVMGGGWAFWQVARLAYVSEITPIGHRGRALSLLGGVNRVGTFVGPILGGFLGQYYGLGSAFYAQAAMGVAASVLMFIVVPKDSGSEGPRGHGAGGRLFATMVEHRQILLSAGLAVVALQMVRQGRDVFLPLWGDAIRLDVAQIGLVFGASSLLDAAMFYPVGHIMDRLGRKWAGIPSLLALSLALLVLPAAHQLFGFIVVAILMGIGNGLAPGIVMTLGADFAPEGRRGEFLGVWRFISDAGSAGGPLAVSFIVGIASLAFASTVVAVLGLTGALVMWRLVPETLQRAMPHVVNTDEVASTSGKAM